MLSVFHISSRNDPVKPKLSFKFQCNKYFFLFHLFFRTQPCLGQVSHTILNTLALWPWAGCWLKLHDLQFHPENDGTAVVAGSPGRHVSHPISCGHHNWGLIPAFYNICHWWEFILLLSMRPLKSKSVIQPVSSCLLPILWIMAECF